MTPLDQLKSMEKIQRASGNWDFDPYMHGLANGLILAVATLEGKEPQFLEAPKEWRADQKAVGEPTVAQRWISSAIPECRSLRLAKTGAWA